MDIHLINRKLKDIYGSDLLDQPIYRVVWSDDLLEKRFETFRDFVPGTNILLREKKEVREVKKYNYLEPQWILERLFMEPNTAIVDNDTLNPRFSSYNCIWSFGFEGKGNNKRAQRPVWRAIELLIKWNFTEKKVASPKEMEEMDMKQLEEDEKIMLEMLNAKGESYFQSALHDGDAIVMPSNYEKSSPLNIEKGIK